MVITPSLETFSMASATIWPTSSSAAEIAATLAISAWPFTAVLMPLIASIAASVAFFMPLRKTMGLAPAARFFMPSFTMAWANTVAVVVPSPATSLVLVATSFTSCAPIFSNASSSSISLAMVTPSLVISGAPKDLSKTTFLPFGPKVTRTVSASWFTPDSSAFLASMPYLISLAIVSFLLNNQSYFSACSWYPIKTRPVLKFFAFFCLPATAGGWPLYSITAKISFCFTITYFSSSNSTSVPEYLE